MARGSEYNGRRDPGKGVPILPRPLRDPALAIRVENLTGDMTGNSPPDNMSWWHGGDYYEGLALQAEVDVLAERSETLDDQYG